MPERLVRGVLLLLLILQIYVRIIRSVHLRIVAIVVIFQSGRLVNRILRLDWLRGDAADAAHAALEADVVHLVDWLARLLDYAKVPVLVHRGDLAFESIHEIRRLRRLPSCLIDLVCGGGFGHLTSILSHIH